MKEMLETSAALWCAGYVLWLIALFIRQAFSLRYRLGESLRAATRGLAWPYFVVRWLVGK